jgi:Xaa-Pro aminopeptidase
MSEVEVMSGRAERLIALLEDAEVDVLIVGDLVNVRYLTGYTGSSGLALVGPGTRVFITDFRYVEQAKDEVESSFERVQAVKDLIDVIPDALPGEAVRVGFDDAHTSVKTHVKLREMLGDGRELVPAGGLVERLRAVKEPEEIERIAAASALADAALTAILEGGLVGRTEREIVRALEFGMRERGAAAPSFSPIVAAGSAGALPHAMPRDVAVARGDLVVIDWGALLDGYCSDCTRTVAAGDPSGEARETYELVLAAQLAGLDAVRAGAGGSEVDAVARELIENGGLGEQFGHGLGHGVGLEIHEAPTLSKRSEDTLAQGNVVTVEPGVYLPGRFGIRIEDLVVVQEDGARTLTAIDKQLIVCD